MRNTTFTNGIGDDFRESEEADARAATPGVLSRAGYHLAGLPLNIGTGLGNSLLTLAGQPHDIPQPEAALGAPKSAAELATDFTLGGLLPMAGELAFTGGAGRILGLANLAKTMPLAATIGNEALSFGMLGAQDDAITGLEQTAEGAAYGALRLLPKWGRIFPALGLGAMSKAFWDRDGESPIMPGSDISQGDIAGTLGAATSILLGGREPWRVPREVPKVGGTTGPIPNHFAESGLTDVGLPNSMEANDVFANARRGPGGLPSVNPWTNAEVDAFRTHGIDPRATGNEALFRNIDQSTGYTAADAADALIEQMLPKKTFTPPQPMVEPVLTGKLAERSAQVIDPGAENAGSARLKSKISKLPEFRRTEGGELGNPLLQAMARSTGGAIAGYTAGELTDTDPNVMAALGMMGVNAPAIFRAIRDGGFATHANSLHDVRTGGIAKRASEAGAIKDPYDERPIGRPRIISTAIKLPDGQVVVGEKWNQKHNTLISEALDQPGVGGDVMDHAGFLIEDHNQNIRWADRTEAARLVKQTGQAGQDYRGGSLISEDLRHSSPLDIERITKPAIKRPDGSVIEGNPGEMHIQVAQSMNESINKNYEMGFVTNKGRYVNREEGARVARAAQQFKEGKSPSIWRLEAEHLKPAGSQFADAKLATFAKGFHANLADKAEQNYAMFDYGLEKGDVVHSTTSGKSYTYVDKGHPAKDAAGERQPHILLRDENGDVNPYKLTNKDGTAAWSKSGDKIEPVRAFKGLSTEGGFVFPEMQAAVARASAGAFVGGIAGGLYNGQEGAIIGAMAGASMLAFGPALSRAITEAIATSKTHPAPSGKPSVPKGWVGMAKNFGQIVEEASGRALATSANAGDRLLRFIDKAFEITTPAIVKETLMKSRGLAAHMLDQMDSALTKVSMRFKPDQALKDLATRHLDGDASMNASMFETTVKQNYGANSSAVDYANYIMAGRKTVDGLQQMVRDGIADPNMRKIINDSIGKYLTRSFKIFTDKAWEPSLPAMDALVKEIHTLKVWPKATQADIRTALEQYVREVKQMKGVYGKAFGGEYGEKINQSVLKERKELSDAWREFLGEITDPSERLNQTVFRLRPMAESAHYLSELSNMKEDGWLPHRFTTYAEKDNFENKLLHDVQNASSPSDQATAQAKLDKFRLKWQGLQNVENHPKFGTLAGNIVTRNVWDTLGTFDSVTNPSSGALRSLAGVNTFIKLGRTAFSPITVMRNILTMPMFAIIAKAEPGDMMEAWKIMKDPNHPLRAEIMKNGIGNVDQVKAEFFKEFENVTGGKYNFGNLDLTTLGLGKFDLEMAEKYSRRGIRNWLDVYRLPDNAVRIGSYLSAKRRFAQSLKLAETAPEVIDRAISFTNRYTMNYDTVAPAIKVGRQMPFVNMFISYTAEMTRILKNLTGDLISGTGENGVNHSRMYAAVPLSMLAVLPELINTSAENELSPKDKADWDKAKALMPSYARTRYRMGIHRAANGQFEYTDITPLIASDALNQTVKALVSGDLGALGSVNPVLGLENTPALNLVTAQVTGQDLHTHREFRGVQDRIATAAKEVLPPWFPGVGSEALRFQQAYGTTDTGEQGLTNQKTGQTLTPSDFWQPYYSGVKTGSVNLSVLKQRAVSEAKRDIANEVAYLNDVLKSNVETPQKQLALERAKGAIAHIQETLRNRVEN